MTETDTNYTKANNQFIKQAVWTKSARNRIYRKIGLKGAKRILEVGCGTGVITKEIRAKTAGEIIAIDINHQFIKQNKKHISGVNFFHENADNLSMRDETFDIVLCNYFLLWQKEKLMHVIREMIRVCKKGGYVAALAEPDYGGWIEYPCFELGKLHIECLEEQGADPYMGRKLRFIFQKLGLETELKTIAQVWEQESLLNNIKQEWELVLDAGKIEHDTYKQIIKKEMECIKKNHRMIFMPVFLITGKK